MKTGEEIRKQLKEFKRELKINLRVADLESQIRAEQYSFKIEALEWVLEDR